MKCSDEEVRKAVEDSVSYSEALRLLGYSVSGTARRRFQVRVESLGLDVSHFDPRGRRGGETWTLEKVYSTYGAPLHHRMKALIREDLGAHCAMCGQADSWNGRKLVLQIDHTNGDSKDHHKENLRLLCPNCHSQTPTYAGRNNVRPPNTCVDCSTEITRRATRCTPCYVKARESLKETRANTLNAGWTPKIDWPDAISLRDLVWSMPCRDVGKQLGVSDNAVRKRCKKLGIILPPQGHFLRKPKNHCSECGVEIQRGSKTCVSCFRENVPWKKASPAGHDPASLP